MTPASARPAPRGGKDGRLGWRMAAAMVVALAAAMAPRAEAQCASYSCWKIQGAGGTGHACMMGGFMGMSTCLATVTGCLKSPCTRAMLTGPGGTVLARWDGCATRPAGSLGSGTPPWARITGPPIHAKTALSLLGAGPPRHRTSAVS